MLLMLDDNHKKHLSFLNDVPVNVVREFCNISLEFIKTGANPKVYQTAAQKLEVDGSTVQQGVEGLMHLMAESSKFILSEIDFEDSVMTVGFSEELRHMLLQFYLENCGEIRSILSEMAVDLPHYNDMQWRLDVQLASRSLRHQTNPIITLKLNLKQHGNTKSKILQTDPVNLIHLTKTLEDALAEMKSTHSRRILRNI